MPDRPRIHRPAIRRGRPRPGTAIACLMAVLMLAAAFAWYLPSMTSLSNPAAEIPNPPGVFSAARYRLPVGGRACMPEVAVTPDSRQVSFALFPVKTGKRGGPPVDFVLTGPGYRSVTHLHGGYPGGGALLAMTPPRQSLLATACFVNRGDRAVSLVGTDEDRTISRSVPLTIDGTQEAGDVSFQFLEGRDEDSLDLLGTIARHASNLTDGLLPPVLVWIIGVLAAFAIPTLVILAFRTAIADSPRT